MDIVVELRRCQTGDWLCVRSSLHDMVSLRDILSFGMFFFILIFFTLLYVTYASNVALLTWQKNLT